MKLTSKQLSRAAAIAALYAALCFFLKPISYGALQIRISEMLCVLPAFIPEAIPGVFIGCVIANLLGGSSVALLDVILGSATTLVAAIFTRRIFQKTNRLLPALIPPVILNTLIVGSYIPLIYTSPGTKATLPLILYSMLTVGAGEAISIYILGLPFANALRKTKIFK